MKHLSQKLLGLLTVVGLALAANLLAADGEIQHQYGPTGIFGSETQNLITVTRVEDGSPAQGKIEPGMKIAGAGTAEFKTHVRRELADAIDIAESNEGAGKLTLLLTDGRKVDLTLVVLGSYSDTSPYNCLKTEAILKRLTPHLQANKQPCRFGLTNLAKMAIGGKEAAEKIGPAWSGGGENRIYCTWDWGYQGIGLAEYCLLTGDKSVLPQLENIALSLARGQDAGGLWGHQLATPERLNRLPGYAQMNQPSLSCLLAMQLAKKCGVNHPELDLALEKTTAFYASFVGRGTLPYGVHPPNPRVFNNNGMSATAAFAMEFSGNKPGVEFFSKLCAMSHGGLEAGHATFAFNVIWTPLGAALAGPEATTRFFREARWLYTMYRSWDGRMTFDGEFGGSPDWSAGLVLPLALGRRHLLITGRDADQSLWMNAEEAAKTLALSKTDYQNSSVDELMELAGSPIPQLSGPAIARLHNLNGDFIPKLVRQMSEGTKPQKMGAISYFGDGCDKETAMPRLDDLGAILRNTKEDIDVRAAAVGALAPLGEPAWKYYSDIVSLVATEKPRDRFGDIDQALGLHLNTLCKNPFASGLVTDKEAFYKTALKLANHKRQHARAEGLRMLAGMPLEDFYRVADTVMHVIEDKDPTYHSYHSPGGPVTAAITILANLHIEEGIQYALEIPDKPYGKHMFKIVACWTALTPYGGNAKAALDKIRIEGEVTGRHAETYKAMVKAIDDDKNPPKMISFKDAVAAGKK